MRVRIIGPETILWVDSFLMMTVPATTKVRVYRVLQVSWRGWPSSTWPGCRLVGDTPAHSATPTLGRGWSESEVSLPVFRSRVFFFSMEPAPPKRAVFRIRVFRWSGSWLSKLGSVRFFALTQQVTTNIDTNLDIFNDFNLCLMFFALELSFFLNKLMNSKWCTLIG